MKTKGVRTLKNGATAGYVKQKRWFMEMENYYWTKKK